MNFLKKEGLRDGICLAAGAGFSALGMALFLVPARLSAGGVGTLGTVFYYLFGIPLSVTTVVLNAALLLAGGAILGRRAALRTVWGILLYSAFLEAFSLLPAFSGETLIGAVGGGCLAGLGVGLTLRAGGSTGGSDLAGLMLKRKFPHVPTTTLILFLDCGVIALAGLVFRSPEVAFYSAAAMFFASRVGGAVLEMGDRAKTLLVISEKSRAIGEYLTKELQRGITLVPCRGGWQKKDGFLLLSAVSPKEAPQVLDAVRKTDPRSFVILFDARQVLGEGFRPLS